MITFARNIQYFIRIMFQKRFLSMVLLVLAGTMSVLAQLEMTLPQDTAVKMGRLENGLTYYIRYNNWPEHRAEFYIAQRVGSLQENDQQRGLTSPAMASSAGVRVSVFSSVRT